MGKKISNAERGFTLVELVVTISIFVVVSTLVFANYPKFKSQLSLKKTSQEIAFAVREAQVYSLSVKSYDNNFNIGYGVHFDKNKSSNVILFADVDNSKEYNNGDKIVKEYAIQTNISIISLCGNENNPPASCELSKLNAVYLRPNPIINLSGRSGDDSLVSNLSDIEIIISSSGEITKKIIIWVSGQITIE